MEASNTINIYYCSTLASNSFKFNTCYNYSKPLLFKVGKG